MLYRYRRPFSKDFLFFLITSFGWLIWWYLKGYQTPKSIQNVEFYAYIVWTLLCSAATIWGLYWTDYFRAFKSYKFLADLLVILSVLPIAGILVKPLVGILFHIEFLRNREILIGSLFPALLAVAFEGLSNWVRSKNSVKYTVYLALTPGEKERFMESIYQGGFQNYYRVLSQEELNGALATRGRVDYIVVSRAATKNFILHQNILQAQMLGVSILDYRTLLNQIRGHISINETDIWTFLAGSLRQNFIDVLYRGFKFYLEPIAAAFGLVLLAPLFVIVGIVIKVSSPGPIFFKQRRTGYLGVDFYLVKFRSMRIDAEASGVKWASKSDDRVTPVGRFLRKSRIDELPQLLNVLKGEMSFMGPRPERPEFYEIIGRQVPHFKLRLLVRPGITGWAQLLGGYAASIEESERKLEYDLYYMQYLSPRMDLIILGRTLLALVRGNSGQ